MTIRSEKDYHLTGVYFESRHQLGRNTPEGHRVYLATNSKMYKRETLV